MSFRKKGKRPPTDADHYGHEFTTDLEEPDPALMERLGIYFGNQRQVKTITHMHPTLSHNNLISQNKKKSTTSPASTLSDKGIGSSVGSFDGEFRHDPSFLHPSRIPYDPYKTGSLDSRRTHDFSSAPKPMTAHVRSSSDIIGSTGRLAPPPNLASQSGAALWDSDPRRNSLRDNVTPTTSMTSIIKTRKSSLQRPKPNSEMPSVKDAEIRKLPQLFRLSPTSSASSSVVSSTHSLAPPVFVNEVVNNKSPSSISTSSDVTLRSEDVTAPCNVIINEPIPPTPIKAVPPPLPPKTSKLRNPVGRSASSPLHKNSDGMDHLRIPSSKHASRQVGKKQEDLEESTLSFGRPRVLSDGAINRKLKDGSSTLPTKGSSRNEASQQTGHLRLQNDIHFEDRRQIPDQPKSGFIESAYNTFTRGSSKRSSTRSNPPERRGGSGSYRHQLADLQPLHFELPHAITSEGVFVGREWLFAEILEILENPSTKGAVIRGKPGHGKTAILHHLASQSYQGWSGGRSRKEHDLIHRASINILSSSPMIKRRAATYGGSSAHSSRTASPASSLAGSRAGSQLSLVEDSCRKLSAQVVAFHFCQSDNNTTCFVPEFLHNIASQMSHAPQLAAYREVLLSDTELQKLLTFRNCIINPSVTLKKAIIDPIIELRKNQRLPKSNLVILIDSVSDVEFHRSDYGYSILSFLEEHLHLFPDFIKLVITCSSNFPLQLPFGEVSLDSLSTNTDRDMQSYIAQRIATSEILSTFTLAGKPDPSVAQKQLMQHLMKTSRGNFLYLRLCLDLIDQGAIVLKSSGFKVIPLNFHERSLIHDLVDCFDPYKQMVGNFEEVFNSYTLFNELRDVIAVVTASLYPLKDDQIFHAVSCGGGPQQVTWEAFNQNLSLCADILILNPNTGRRSFFHPFFKKWFLGQIEMEQPNKAPPSHRFKVNVRRGHALLATVLSQQPAERLHKHATLELAHHVIHSQMFENATPNSQLELIDQAAHFMAQCSLTITDALISPRTLFNPKLKVVELLLRSGADSNTPSSVLEGASPLSVAAHLGYTDLVSLLLTWGSEVNFFSSDGKTPMTYAAATGNIDIITMLLRYQPVLSQPDQTGYTPLLHAIKHNHTGVAKMLLSHQLYLTPDHHLVAMQQALVAASTKENLELIEYLLDESDFNCDVNFLEPSHGESPLTSAAAHGRARVCEILIRNYHASPHFRNKKGLPPLLCAVKYGQWDAADVLLNCGASMEERDPDGKSPLILTASHGHVGILQLLLSRGADTNLVDNEGLTALCWATLQGHVQCVRGLIDYNSNLDHCDVRGRRAIDLAVLVKDEQIAGLLLEAGSDVRHSDVTGMSTLDLAIQSENAAIVSKLLRYGADVQASSWKMANGKDEIISVLLKSLLDVANSSYRSQDFESAIRGYSRALKRVGELSPQRSAPMHEDQNVADTCAHLLLGYSRSMRKIGKLDEAETAVSRALQLKSGWFEALYARSRVLREKSRLDDALRDVIEAEQNSPIHSLKEIRRLKSKIKEELGLPRSPPLPTEREANQLRLHGESHHSFNSKNVNQAFHSTSQANPMGRLVRGNSQDSIAESMVSLSMYPNESQFIKEEPFNAPEPHHRPTHQFYPQQHQRFNENRNNMISNQPITSSQRSDAGSHVTGGGEDTKYYVTDL